jgi:type IV pilus assembly protein PilW
MSHRRGQRGIGLVELMVGMTVGLIVATAAAIMATGQITEHRRLMLETQVQQDLRAAADLLQQDMRRAGYRGLADNGIWTPAGAATPAREAASSPYTEVKVEGHTITYRYARQDATGGINTTNVLADKEKFGIKLEAGALYLLIGGTWQPITDPGTVLITQFDIAPKSQPIVLSDFCDKPCPDVDHCLVQDVRQVTFTIQGVATHDDKVQRTLVVTERIRADDLRGACPA